MADEPVRNKSHSLCDKLSPTVRGFQQEQKHELIILLIFINPPPPILLLPAQFFGGKSQNSYRFSKVTVLRGGTTVRGMGRNGSNSTPFLFVFIEIFCMFIFSFLQTKDDKSDKNIFAIM